MAKVAFTKLSLKVDNTAVPVEWNDQIIEVKQYLSVEDKLNTVMNIVSQSIDANAFCNPCRLEVFYNIELILAYAGITITEKQREDSGKLYDLLVSSGFAEHIKGAIPMCEQEYILNGAHAMLKAIYDYKNSALGIIDAVNLDAKNLDANAQTIQEKLADPENLNLVKNVLTKLG